MISLLRSSKIMSTTELTGTESKQTGTSSTDSTETESRTSLDELAILGLYTKMPRPQAPGILTLSLPKENFINDVTELARSSVAICGSNPAQIATIRDTAGYLDVFIGNGSPSNRASEECYVTRLRVQSDGTMRRIGRAKCGVSPSSVMAVRNGIVVACATDGALWSYLTTETFRVCDVIQPGREYGYAPGLRSHISHAVTLTATENCEECDRFIVCDENASVISLVRRRCKGGRLKVATWLHVNGPATPTKIAAGSIAENVVHVATKDPPSILSVMVSGSNLWDGAANLNEFDRRSVDGDGIITDIRSKGDFLFASRDGGKAGIFRYALNSNGSIKEGKPQFWPTRILSPICMAIGEHKTVIGLQGGGIILAKTEMFLNEEENNEFRTIHSLQDVQDIGNIVIVKRSEVF